MLILHNETAQYFQGKLTGYPYRKCFNTYKYAHVGIVYLVHFFIPDDDSKHYIATLIIYEIPLKPDFK